MSGGYLCACVGPKNGDPVCPCRMRGRNRGEPGQTNYYPYIGDPMPGQTYDWSRVAGVPLPGVTADEIRRIVREELARKLGEDAA